MKYPGELRGGEVMKELSGEQHRHLPRQAITACINSQAIMRKPGDITVIHRTLDVTESSSFWKQGDSPPAIAIIQAAIHIAAITTTAMRKV